MKKITFAALWVAALSLCAVAQAQSYPSKAVTLVVGFPAGSNPDLVARDLAKPLSEAWGQPVIVMNRAGTGSVIATDFVAKAAPDGYTLYLSSGAPFVVAPFLQEKLNYNPLTDLTPISMVGTTSLVLVTNPDSKFKTFKEFIAAAKSQPGEIPYGSFGVGSLHHLTMEQMQRTTGVKLRHIPYGPTGPIQDVLGGSVPVTWSSLQVSPLIEQGKLIALAYSGPKRTPRLPNVPTVAEQGYPNFETSTWFGVIGPANLPPAIVEKVEKDVERIVGTAAFQKNMGDIGNEAVYNNAAEFSQRIKKEYAENKTLFEELKIKKE